MAPFLRRIELPRERIGPPDEHPFDLPIFQRPFTLELNRPVTLLVGENGSGKSTLLEALAWHAGFNLEGGTRHHHYQTREHQAPLADALRVGWMPKTGSGFFLRAESFFNLASYLEDTLGPSSPYHRLSHGEAFLRLFEERFRRGLFLLDEPEAALSPQRQLTLLRIIHDLALAGGSQFIIATHAPILLASPGALLLQLDEDGIHEAEWEQLEHVQLMRAFLERPARYLRHLLE